MIRLTVKQRPSDGPRTPETLKRLISRGLRLSPEAFSVVPKKCSVDARKEPVFVWTADLTLNDPSGEEKLLRTYGKRFDMKKTAPERPYVFPFPEQASPEGHERPVVVGFGPSGLFCALMLARAGMRPVVLERGGPMEERVPAVERFFREGILDPEANVQFGEGGAGTFSDGKLNTNVRDKSFRGTFVLEQFVRAGAPEEVLWMNKPHIGTDLLRNVIVNLRKEILSLGGEVRFHARVESLLLEESSDDGSRRVLGVRLSGGEEVRSNTVVLALGHSSRDTFRALRAQEIPMEKKPFSVGVRIEHLQRDIDVSQYGDSVPGLPPADYKLVCRTPSGRTVYTFCMCPGGTVVPAASDPDGVVTNGMSLHARDGENANAALLCEVLPGDVPGDLFSGVRFQEALEKTAYSAGGGGHRAPAQKVGDFLAGIPTESFGIVRPTYARGVKGCLLDDVLPPFVTLALREALPELGRTLHGFDAPDAVLTAVESRTTSPVRILRGNDGQSAVKGLFPVGEGAGYAGGIVSAAIDGLKCAERIVGMR